MQILLKNSQRKHAIDTRQIKQQIATILRALDAEDVELSLLFTGDARIRRLNREFRSIDRPTDVLSFPCEQGVVNENGEQLLGDVVISVETAERQSAEHNLSFEEELILLAIHGILHLMGHDHERSAAEARAMQRKTRQMFQAVFPGRKPSGTSNF